MNAISLIYIPLQLLLLFRPQLPEHHKDWQNSFDLVLAADCFFLPDSRATSSSYGGLLRCIDWLLSSRRGSAFLALAPRRGGTLQAFVELASSTEICERFHWTALLLPPSIIFPDLPGDTEKVVPHLVYLQRI